MIQHKQENIQLQLEPFKKVLYRGLHLNLITLSYYMHKYIFQYKAYFDIRIRILTISNKIAISVASTSICNDSL